MAVSKKGYYFTLTAVMLLGLLILYIGADSSNETAHAKLAGQRLDEIDTFITSTKADASVALYVATYRSLMTLEEQLLTTKDYIDNPQEKLQELIINGTLEEEAQPLLAASSMQDWQTNIALLARHLRISLNLNDIQVSINQQDPWNLQATMHAQLTINDTLTQATWNLPLQAKTLVPISNLYDPIYTIGSGQRYLQRITPAPPGANTQELLQQHLYLASELSPSYLGRLQGDLTPSPNGIQSLVDVPALAAVDVIKEGSIIDWHYLIKTNTTTCRLQGQPVWARINIEHDSLYGQEC